MKGEADAVDILFTNFISTLVQQPKVVPFLPIGKIMAATAGVERAGAGIAGVGDAGGHV